MIRRKWVIYERRSRQIVSVLYHQRKLALNDLSKLNDYCGKKKYAMQIRRFDTEKKCFINRYPNIDLKELPSQGHEGHKGHKVTLVPAPRDMGKDGE